MADTLKPVNLPPPKARDEQILELFTDFAAGDLSTAVEVATIMFVASTIALSGAQEGAGIGSLSVSTPEYTITIKPREA